MAVKSETKIPIMSVSENPLIKLDDPKLYNIKAVKIDEVFESRMLDQARSNPS